MVKKHIAAFASRLLPLLISLIILLIVHPFVPKSENALLYMQIALSVVLIAGVYAVAETRRQLQAAVALGTIVLLINWAVVNFGLKWQLIGLVLTAFFYAYVALLIFKHVAQAKEVTLDTLYGAVAVYLLIGLGFGIVYTITDSVFPHSFSAVGLLNWGDYLYFSYVTLATVGYGDLTPMGEVARSVAVLEAIIGVMYLAIMIGKLVGAYSYRNNEKKNA